MRCRVHFAFKAPVAMTLVPWWLQAADKLMFLHVLRDGRDIAFSANQGPVNKVDAPMYGKRIAEVPTGAVSSKAIKLWADWNNGLRQWAEAKVRSLHPASSSPSQQSTQQQQQQFDYLPVHIEDLVDAADEVRLNAIVLLAQFVGSGVFLPACLPACLLLDELSCLHACCVYCLPAAVTLSGDVTDVVWRGRCVWCSRRRRPGR